MSLEKLVIEEATKLKEYAKQSELDKLNPVYVNGVNVYYCIYGLLTGYCRSERARFLLRQCAVPYSMNPYRDMEVGEDASFIENPDIFFSPIECYVARIERCDTLLRRERIRKYAELTDFLQGRTEVLEICHYQEG